MGKAKRGGVFGLLRGSVGPATYSIGKDGAGKKQQIVREKPVEVANPRTRAQAIQRMKMVPIQYAMNLLSDIVDHSFVGVAEGWPSKRHFLSLAMRELDVPFIRKGSLDRAIGGYQISDGSLGDTRAHNATLNSGNSQSLGYMVPCVDGIVLPTTNHVTYASWCADFISLNPTFANGDEIAVLYFVINYGTNKHVDLKKFRLLLDTNFTTVTPDDFKRTYGEGDAALTFDFNALYALSQYNEDIPAAVYTEFIESMYLVPQIDGVATLIVPEFLSLLQNYDRPSSEAGAVANSVALTGTRACYFTTDAIQTARYVAQNALEGNTNNRVAAAALIVSRHSGSSWNYTISDICLTAGYLATVNTAALMEAAIASYMTETGVDSNYSEYYLQLTQEQVDNYGIASVNVNGSITVGETQTAVTALINGRVNPMTGKNILFVNADGYVIMDGMGADVSLGMGGYRWKNASTGAYITPTAYVKASEIADTSNIEFATLVD